jgi:hypothetical protein
MPRTPHLLHSNAAARIRGLRCTVYPDQAIFLPPGVKDGGLIEGLGWRRHFIEWSGLDPCQRARCRKRGGSNPSCRLPWCVLPSIGVRGRALALPTLTNPMPPHQRRLGHHKVSPRARRLLDGANGGDYVIYRTLTTEMILLRISHRILLPRYEKNPWSPTTVASMSVTRSHMGKDQSSVAAALSCCQTSKYRIGRLYGVKIVVMTSWYGHLSMCELVHSEYSSLFTSVIWSVYCQANDEFLFYSCTLQWISGWGSCPDSVSYE